MEIGIRGAKRGCHCERAAPSLRASGPSLRAKRSNPVRGPFPAGLLRRFATRNDNAPRHCEQAAHCRAKQSSVRASPGLDCFAASRLAMTTLPVIASKRSVIASERHIAERSNPVRGPSPAGLLRRFATRNDNAPRHCERAAHCRAKQPSVRAFPGWIASPLRGSQ
jgi:hypothetical protein